MAQTKQSRHNIPHSPIAFQYSRPALGVLVSTVLLGLLLVFSTLQNINRARLLMEQFLLDKGQTIIRSIEAGSRATMAHHIGTGDPIHTLFTEYSKDEDILYILIVDQNGTVLEHVGNHEKPNWSTADMQQLNSTDMYLTKMDVKSGIFTLSKKFIANREFLKMHVPPVNQSLAMSPVATKTFITIGLRTLQFDEARKQDVRHALFMGAILFLVSMAGMYLLFLYQKMRLTSANLADIKLYTDNIIESIPVCLITINTLDRVVSCNGNTVNLLGGSQDELIGRKFHDLLPTCSSLIGGACNSGNEVDIDCMVQNGLSLPLRVSCSPLLDNEGKRIGKVLILRDMSSIKNMEAQLERSRRMAALGKMAAGVAHEIRNPLGTLRGFAHFFGQQSGSGEEIKEYSKLMIGEIDRLNQTVSELLQFSRPRNPDMKKVDIEALFSKTVRLMNADISAKGIEIVCRNEINSSITADPDLLLQVLINLLKNSINASDDNGRIYLMGKYDSHHMCITVKDCGKGMSVKDRERMFDPFFTTTSSGTGLGLTVSHQIIDQHNGTFEIETSLGVGTSITICLPVENPSISL